MAYRFEYRGFALIIDVAAAERGEDGSVRSWDVTLQEEVEMFPEEPRNIESYCGLGAAHVAADDYIKRNGLKDGTVIIDGY